MSMRATTFLSILLLCFCLGTRGAFAQIEQTITVRTSPAVIQVGKKIALKVVSPVIDIDTALIVWKLDGAIIQQGIGVIDAEFTPADTRVALVEVIIATQDGIETSIKKRIQAADIDLIWEGVSYTPPTYAGRALVGPGGTVKVAALAHGTGKTADTLVYTWFQDGTPLQKQSGFGKSAITVQMPPFGDSSRISVEIKTLQSEYIGGNGIRITPVQPQVRVYEQRPLVGLWLNAQLDKTDPIGDLHMRALPYFIDGTALNQKNITFDWKSPTGTITVETPSGASYKPEKDNAEISISISNTSKVLQQQTGHVRIAKPLRASLFGI
jgi:hypothetical protein